MKIKDEYVLRTVAGQNIVIPPEDKAAVLRGAFTLNETGAFIWRTLETGSTRDGLINALCESYEIDAVTAAQSVDKMLAAFERYGVLEK